MLRSICVHTLPRGVFEDCAPYRDQTSPGAGKTVPRSRPEGYRHWVPGPRIRATAPRAPPGNSRARGGLRGWWGREKRDLGSIYIPYHSPHLNLCIFLFSKASSQI